MAYNPYLRRYLAMRDLAGSDGPEGETRAERSERIAALRKAQHDAALAAFDRAEAERRKDEGAG